MSLLYYAGTASVLLAIALCLWHASTSEQYAFLAVGFLYGYVLEQVMITFYETYYYDTEQFALTLFDVPLHIAIAWTAILYSGWQIGQYLGLSNRRLPFFVALFGLHIDLSMDVIAIRVGYWSWDVPGLWFGVPLHNFYGWFLVAFFFVGSYVALGRYVRRPAVRLGVALPASLLLLVAAVLAWSALFSWSMATEIATVLGLIAVGLLAVATDDLELRPLPRRLAATSFIFHLFFLAVLLVEGFYLETPLLLVIALAMIGVSVLLHGYPKWHHRRHRSRRATG